MSEEMNLYKRCKNIFKAHGVDMGGGNFIVNVTVDLSTGAATADKDLFDIETAVHAGSAVTAIVSMGDAGSIYLGMSMYEEVPQGAGLIPYEASFGPYVPSEGQFGPMLSAKIDMDGDTNWTVAST